MAALRILRKRINVIMSWDKLRAKDDNPAMIKLMMISAF
jgi:hypothetical protein